MLRDPAESESPNDRLIAVHACFTALFEGRTDEARGRFPAEVLVEAEAMLARHAELERRSVFFSLKNRLLQFKEKFPFWDLNQHLSEGISIVI